MRAESPEDVDYVYFVTAHEVAHQWWGHQLIGANAQGAAMLTTASDSALSQFRRMMDKLMKDEAQGIIAGSSSLDREARA